MSNLEWLKNRRNELVDEFRGTAAADFAIDIEDGYDIYNESSFEDAVRDWADGYVDVYTSDLRDWAKDHMVEVEDVINEYGWDAFKSMDKAIMAAQAEAAEREVFDAMDDFVPIIAIDYILNNYDEDTIELIDVGHIVDDIVSWDEFSYIDSEIESSIEDYE